MSKPVGSSQDREFMASHRLIRLGYQPVAIGETEIKNEFAMPVPGKCVDIVAKNRRGAYIVAECKGTDVQHAIQQLNATVPYVQKKHALVEPQIILNAPIPERGKITPTLEIGQGYKAKFLKYGNAHVLVAPNGTEVTLHTGHKVMVVFDFQ
jgi:hypothetical protein